MSKEHSLSAQSPLAGGETKPFPATLSVMHEGALQSRPRETGPASPGGTPQGVFKSLNRKPGRRGKGGKGHSGQLQQQEADRGITQQVQQGTHRPRSITGGKAQSREGRETRLTNRAAQVIKGLLHVLEKHRGFPARHFREHHHAYLSEAQSVLGGQSAFYKL